MASDETAGVDTSVADALAGRTDDDGLNIETANHMVLAYV